MSLKMIDIKWTTDKPKEQGWYFIYPCRWYGQKSTRLAYISFRNGNMYIDGSAVCNYVWSDLQKVYYSKIDKLPIPEVE